MSTRDYLLDAIRIMEERGQTYDTHGLAHAALAALKAEALESGK